MTQLSPHFTLEELTFSSTAERLGLSNVPNAAQMANLTALANEQLEQVRTLWNCIVHVDSGLRVTAVNKAVGGATNSQHRDGNAADLIPKSKLTIKQAYELILNSTIPFDQLIYEFGTWVHISRAPTGQKPRHQALMIGSWTKNARGVSTYELYDGSKIPS
jgi:hypothetical protein